MKNILLGCVIFFIGLGILIRSIETVTGNYLFSYDQGRDYMAVRNIVDNHKLTLIGAEGGAGYIGVQGIFHGPGYWYLLTIPYMLFKGNPYGGVVFAFIFGLLSLGLMFMLSNKIFGFVGGITGLTLLSISPPIFSQSRFVWAPHFATPFILLWFFIFIQKKTTIQLILLPFLASFLYHFELQFAVVLLTTYAIYLFIIKREISIRVVITFLCSTIIGFLPMIVFEARHRLIIGGVLRFISSNHMFTSFPIMKEFIGDLNNITYALADMFPQHGYLNAIVIVIGILTIALYFYFLEKKMLQKEIVGFSILHLFVSYVIFFVYRGAVYPHYLLTVQITFLFLTIYSIVSLIQINKRFSYVVLLSIFLLLFTTFMPKAFAMVRYDWTDYGGTQKIKGKINVVDEIYKDANGQPFGLFIFTPPVFTEPYDYTVNWYGKKTYGYVPNQSMNGLFYLLIEPSIESPWSYKGWVETVIKKGDLVWEKTLDNGFIIQKRIGIKSL